MTEDIRILVVDDHPMVRQGLRTFLDVQDDMTVVGEASDGASCLEAAERLRPDVILLDLRMPGTDGVFALRGLRDRGNPARVLVVTSFVDPAAIIPAVRAGAAGYVYKDVNPSALVAAVRSVHAGHVLLHPDVARLLAEGDTRPGDLKLTSRELVVLGEVAQGLSNREIAKRLALSEKTVKAHMSAILGKLGMQDRTQAALYAVRMGLVSLVGK
ncbi:putative two-component system response regulator [Alloactinosynnema sp. L-07]|uniref:response regulator n=1 Tax=Alloactinosynnema sp. L-07 TaxID=1653480 RepID=UPI00065EF70E|nr:response regulator transcription factor [Alloactinosynnema sp. L-07]CRK58912.1 putative two-component system response regulator [Alloactinosynnema sp. L-07]